MKRESKPQPKRETLVTCRINGVEVTLEELAREINRCGGLKQAGRGSK
jgi:hypothetical protein